MEFKSFFSMAFKVLKLIGFAMVNDWNDLKHRPIRFLFAVIRVCYYWFLVLSLVLFGILSGVFAYQNFKDLELSANSSANCVLLIIITGKSITLWWKRATIVDLMSDLKSEFDVTKTDIEARSLTEKTFKSVRRYQRIYASLVLTAGFVAGSTPMIMLIISGNWDLKLPHQLWFPFEIKNIFNFFCWYIFLEFLSLAAKWLIISSDLIFHGLIVVLSIEFEILAMDLENYKISYGYEGVKRLVIRHEKLLDISGKLESAFTVANFILFSGSSMMMCFPAFQMVSADESFTVLRFALFFVAAIMQIYLVCFYGDKLEVSSKKVSEKALKCDWYNCEDKRIKDALKLILLKSQKPVNLTALKFTNISMQTFGSVNILSKILSIDGKLFPLQVMNTFYSYFTLLMTKYG